ncbi:MAG TPA: bifunctional demethylmenaquinone methyltransferase/2-methoxy-6-polyprenyl-1,4-benzoquinol methylase UbiE [Terriglobales bacterium]
MPPESHPKNRTPVIGAAPAGTVNEQSAAQAVRQMFDEIAPRYDLLNHVLSCNIDRLWWWRVARAFSHILRRENSQVLDLCCGTGDMAAALRRQTRNRRPLYAADFSHGMLTRGKQKFAAHSILAIEADALQLPFPNARFDLVTSAFGFRNLSNYDRGLREIHRVLRDGGEIGILDFSEPGGIFGKIYQVYFRQVLPRVGALISGVKGPYSYLPASVERFPAPSEMLQRMRAAGFRAPSWQPYSFGIAGLYRAQK